MDNKISDKQQEIMERNKQRDVVPKRGKLENNKNTEKDTVFFNFVSGAAKLEIHGVESNTYEVRFIDASTDSIIKEFTDVKTGEWVQADEEYYVNWVMSVKNIETDKVDNYSSSLENKKVFIAFESSALGDTLAWLPVVNTFRLKYKCEVVCSSFHNYLFKDVYPDIEFIERGQPITGMHMAFKLGWFGTGHEGNRNPYDCHLSNLQQIAMDILGLDFDEIGEVRPNLSCSSDKGKIIKAKKYVCITTCSTAQFKYWNKEGGWQDVVNELKRKGYEVVNVGKQPNVLNNVINFTGKRDMDDLMNVIQNSSFFIGLPSGLSWLSWALGKKSIMITGISEHFCEFQEDIYRVENLNVCHGCFNQPYEWLKDENGEYKLEEGEKVYDITKPVIFDRGDWLYCAKHKDTPRHFECTKTITSNQVMKKVSLVEKHIKNKVTTILDSEGNLTNKGSGGIICKYGM